MAWMTNKNVEVLQVFLNLDPIDHEKSGIPPYSTDN
jgi:hypothetical protein